MQQSESNTSTGTNTGRDNQLWEIAKRRVSFKYNLAAYMVVNTFFWILWYLSGVHNTHNGFPWPVWPMFGWGIGLFFHSLGAYAYPRINSVEKEYERLVKRER